jgi:3-deoxy-D-arabino-heptulosonate 7-phosphate (DAHP) synthase
MRICTLARIAVHGERLSHLSQLRARLLVILFRVYILRPRTNPTTWRANMAKAKKKAKKKAAKKK